jgi:predicted dehydrogenase
VIGIKGVGRDHIKSVLRNPDADLTAIVDIDKEAVDAAAKKFRVAGFTDFRAMLEAGCVDAVSIATPHHTHGLIGLECLRAGVHTFIEKPLCNKVSEADSLLSTARKNSLKICVGSSTNSLETSACYNPSTDQDEEFCPANLSDCCTGAATESGVPRAF